MDLQQIRHQFERKRGQQTQIQKSIKIIESEFENIRREISISEKSQAIIIAVAKATQEELQYHITEPVSLALASVYNEDPYKMYAKFDITGKGNTECILKFERGGYLIEPVAAGGGSGGGPIDVASFALRIGSWSLSQPRARPLLVLDEPFRWVSRNKMPLAGQMLKQISKELGLQVIMVTHISELIECADKVIEVGIRNGVSYLKE